MREVRDTLQAVEVEISQLPPDENGNPVVPEELRARVGSVFQFMYCMYTLVMESIFRSIWRLMFS